MTPFGRRACSKRTTAVGLSVDGRLGYKCFLQNCDMYCTHGDVKTETIQSNDLDVKQSINQFICPNGKQTLDRTPREDATSANRCP